jgi:hypothetical protein
VWTILIWLNIGNFRFPENADDFLSSWAATGMSRTQLHGVRANSVLSEEILNIETNLKFNS